MQCYSSSTSRAAKSASKGCFTHSARGPVVRCRGQQHRQAVGSALAAGSLLSNSRSANAKHRDVAANAQLVGCKLVGVGSSVPSTVLSNADLEQFVETNDEWITTRTGIKRRHILAEGETMSQHAAQACIKALEMAGVSAEDVNIVLMSTSTPDDVFGSACQVGTDKTVLCTAMENSSGSSSSAVLSDQLSGFNLSLLWRSSTL